MSTRSTLILTNDNEHWYKETNSPRYDDQDKFIGWDVEIDINDKNIMWHDEDDGSTSITIKGGSQIARIISHHLKNVDESKFL
jgi:hypothetical protein